MTKNTKILIAVLCGAAVIGGGYAALNAYTGYVVEKTKTEIQAESETKRSEKNTLISYLATPHSSREIEETLLAGLPKLGKDDATDVVDTYIYGVYNMAADAMMSDDDTNAIYATIGETGGIDISKVQDEKIRTALLEKAESHVVPRYVNGSMFYDVDYGYFVDTFGEYLLDEYREMLSFYEEEKVTDYCNEANELLHTDVVTARMDKLYDIMSRYPLSDVAQVAAESYYFYKAVYLGAYSQDYVFDVNKIRPEILASYKEYALATKDPAMAEFLAGLIADYEEVDGTKSAYIYEKIREFCGFYADTATSSTYTGTTASEAASSETTAPATAPETVPETTAAAQTEGTGDASAE